MRQYDRVLRVKNTYCIPAVWRDDRGAIVYSADQGGRMTFDVPYSWGNAAEATIYRITPEGLQQPERVRRAAEAARIPPRHLPRLRPTARGPQPIQPAVPLW